jgi:hypothetical protein
MIEFGPLSSTKFLYRDAWLYCHTFNYNGHKDWRMITKADAFVLALDGITIYSGTWIDKTVPDHMLSNNIFGDFTRAHVIPVRDKND